ncbi:MAG: hypothetical protein GY757_05415, partial [bacterium]|nr:hypothetical protein [bacterium]
MRAEKLKYNKHKRTGPPKKILLLMLPFWDPLIPPQGICSLKTYLQHHGHPVKTADGNTENKFKQLYERYFNTMREIVPPEKRGNFYNIGHDVLRTHMMAHINYKGGQEYLELVKVVIYKTYYTRATEKQVLRLKENLDEFYAALETYLDEQLEKEKPAVLGISVYRDTMPASLYAFRKVKEHYPEIMTVMGGSTFANELAAGSPDLE